MVWIILKWLVLGFAGLLCKLLISLFYLLYTQILKNIYKKKGKIIHFK